MFFHHYIGNIAVFCTWMHDSDTFLNSSCIIGFLLSFHLGKQPLTYRNTISGAPPAEEDPRIYDCCYCMRGKGNCECTSNDDFGVNPSSLALVPSALNQCRSDWWAHREIAGRCLGQAEEGPHSTKVRAGKSGACVGHSKGVPGESNESPSQFSGK